MPNSTHWLFQSSMDILRLRLAHVSNACPGSNAGTSLRLDASRRPKTKKKKQGKVLNLIYITGRTSGIGTGLDKERGVGVPGSSFDTAAGIVTRCSFAGSSGASWTTAGSGFPRQPGGVVIVSVSSPGRGGGVASSAGSKTGGAVARTSMAALMAANSSLPVQGSTRESRLS